LNPDILTLDLEMPRMDGLSFLAKLMKHHPLPVVVVSSQAPEGSRSAMTALELGAVEIVPKPGSQFTVPDVGRKLIYALRAAAAVPVEKLKIQKLIADKESPKINTEGLLLKTTRKVIAIGASTGGTQAIEAVMSKLPADAPGTVIVQHMPATFTGAFAKRLNKVSPMEVREARDRDDVSIGVALVAPGDKHMVLTKDGARYQVRIKDGPRVHFQRPSVDVLFQSVAISSGQNAIGVLLTGMGADGAKGMLAMHAKGAHTIVQDEESCIIFGMPKEAINLGGVKEILPLNRVPGAILKQLHSSQN
jgi:two-component system chemotaxis response regulator CheB